MIRHAGCDDLDKIELIEQEFGAEAFSKRSLRHLISKAQFVFVYETIEDGVVGYIAGLTRKNSTNVRLYSVIVKEQYRGNEYGVALIHYLMNRSREAGYKSISLEVSENNHKAIGIYYQFGFEPQNHIPNYYHDGSGAIKLSKML
jgi:ribosomal-protein-alanine N-acetyltransferase